MDSPLTRDSPGIAASSKLGSSPVHEANSKNESASSPMLDPNDPRLIALLESYRRYMHRTLASPKELYGAPFVVLAHGTELPPILWYGNAKALELWEMDFADFTQMESYKTAEPGLRDARERLLREVTLQGYSAGYRGIRITRTGRRFEIDQATVFNIIDKAGKNLGQAATFDRWHWLE